MEKGNTKEQILAVALDLFSVRGYEATSISQIAEAIGVRKASLYSHFASKQDILDTLLEQLTKKFKEHSIFENADWENPEFTADKKGMTAESAAAMIKEQIR